MGSEGSQENDADEGEGKGEEAKGVKELYETCRLSKCAKIDGAVGGESLVDFMRNIEVP